MFGISLSAVTCSLIHTRSTRVSAYLEQSATGQKQCCACRKAAGNFRESTRYVAPLSTHIASPEDRARHYRQIAVICKQPCFSSLLPGKDRLFSQPVGSAAKHPYHLRLPVLQLLATLLDFRSQVSLQQSLVQPSLRV